MTAPRHFPPVEFLRECFTYNPLTGRFRWRNRPRHHFPNSQAHNAWNARFAGSEAFGVTSAAGYPTTKLKFQGVAFRMFAARVAWALVTGEHPKAQVDHKDCNRLNTVFSNLRSAEDWQNMANRRVWKDGLKGSYRIHDGRHRAIITVEGKRKHLGYFSTPEEAHAAYMVAAAEGFGEFARAA